MNSHVQVERKQLDTVAIIKSFANRSWLIEEEATITLAIPTDCGELLLKNIRCWTSPEPLPTGLGDILLSRDIMKTLGYDQQELLSQAR